MKRGTKEWAEARKKSSLWLAYAWEKNIGAWTGLREAVTVGAKIYGVPTENRRRSEIAIDCYLVMDQHGYQVPDSYVPPWLRHGKPIPYEIAVSKEETVFKEFYQSWEWKRLRYKILCERGRKCECCGVTAGDGAKIVVDHIKPIRLHWKLRLERNNCQVLCDDCNMGKGSRDTTDWRAENVA